jgi:hypothetical protein
LTQKVVIEKALIGIGIGISISIGSLVRVRCGT